MAANQYTRDGRTPAERFWLSVAKSDGCWKWIGTDNSRGYGTFYVAGKKIRAHRFAWEITNGQIEDGKVVCHRCDDTLCVNPAHLFLGTQRDNLRDMQQKGRKALGNRNPAKGEAHGQSKLTAGQVAEIRHAHANGALQVRLAGIYGVTPTTISEIVHRKKWK